MAVGNERFCRVVRSRACIGACFRIYLPAVITLCYGFLTIRKDDATVLYYIRYAARYFITEQQTYKWEKQRQNAYKTGVKGETA